LTEAGAWTEADPRLSAEAEAELLKAMLIAAIERGDLADVRRMLDAGAPLDGGDSETSPLGQACWRGRVAIVRELLDRGAPREFANGGSALGATRHGAGHCNHPEGGPTMATVEEIDQRPYEEIEALLGADPGSASPVAEAGA
jgi:hypothetical protein